MCFCLFWSPAIFATKYCCELGATAEELLRRFKLQNTNHQLASEPTLNTYMMCPRLAALWLTVEYRALAAACPSDIL